jgi:hypothetical protein
MTTRKIKRNMVGGKLIDPDKIDITQVNSYFYKLFMFYLIQHELQYEKIITKDPTYIFIGLIEQEERNIIFGTRNLNREIGSAVSNKLTIDDTPSNIKLVNQFKLYIMSIMANYTLSNGNTLFKDLDAPIKALDIPKIIEILEITEIKEDATVSVKPPPPQNDDMLELHIYKEFGIKCILKGECYKNIDEKFFKNNPTIKRGALKESTFRDLYVNLFEYITGSEISVFSKEKGLLSCVEKIDVALKDLKTILTGDEFNGPRTSYKFNIKTLIPHINKIRGVVNKSLEITGGYHINENIFNSQIPR